MTRVAALLDLVKRWFAGRLARYPSRAAHVPGTALPIGLVRRMACLRPKPARRATRRAVPATELAP